jgi:hypothetical protein
LLVLRPTRKRAPNLTFSDRLLCGFWSIFLSPGRIRKAAIALQPSTLLAFHHALVRRKYRQLFSSTPCPKTVTGADVCRMFNAAIYGQDLPRHLSTDHDPLFEAHRWRANLRILEIDEIKTVFTRPALAPVRGARGRDNTPRISRPRAVLEWPRSRGEFGAYYNAARCHALLDGQTPLTFATGRAPHPADLNVRWVSPLPGSCASPGGGLTRIRDT